MGKKYKHTAGGRNFVIFRDYFGMWTVRSADEDFSTVVGAPPFSVGHPTKKHAIEFLDGLVE